jgi:hypothetical protein
MQPINTTIVIISLMTLQWVGFVALSLYWWHQYQVVKTENNAFKEHVKDEDIIAKVKAITDRTKLVDLVRQDLSGKPS